MKIISILKKMAQYNIISLMDFYFSTILFHDFRPKIILLSTCVSHYVNNGHICLPLKKITNQTVFTNKNNKLINKLWELAQIEENDWINELLNTNIISDGSRKTPFILHNKKVYTNKLWSAEQKVFKFISKKHKFSLKNKKYIKYVINNIFDKNTDTQQKIAIVLSIINDILFIIGGPGTGKTTITLKILIVLIRLSKNKLKIQLTALTGKAANNLTNSIQKNIKLLNVTQEEKKILNNKAITIHKFLEKNLNKNLEDISVNHALNDIDVLIIDETSMLDIILMEKITTSVAKTTKIIFLGDYNQLPSIYGGHILKDICSYYKSGFSTKTTQALKKILTDINIKINKNYKFSNINDKIVMLKKNYRFNINSDISKFSEILLKKKISNMHEIYNNTNYKNIKFINYFNKKNGFSKIISEITKNYESYWNILKQKISFTKIINIFNHYKLLCILKNELFGVENINLEIEQKMKDIGWIKKVIFINKEPWYLGKPIMILKNNTTMNLVNGECGLTLLDENNQLRVFFLSNDKYITRSIPINLVPEHQTNWAMTVHKSQGSEFFHVSLIIPPDDDISILTKELIYTAITRSKKKITIYSHKKTFIKSISNSMKRYSGLSNKN